MSMGGSFRNRAFVGLVALLAIVVSANPSAAGPGKGSGSTVDAFDMDDVVLEWNLAALEGVRRSTLGPPMVARALAIIHTCMFDAWAAYDQKAVGTRLDGSLRRPPRERAVANKHKAMSFAAYRAVVDLMPQSRAAIFDPLMAKLGYDPGDTSTDTANPAGIGNVACGAVLDFRHRDGSNQLGDEPGGTPGVAYSDTTGYVPANRPMDTRAAFEPGSVLDPDAWQPLTYTNIAGAVVTPAFLGAHWGRVTPFALTSGSELRPSSGPARFGSPEFIDQARDVLELSANLTDAQKTAADYWADGPRSETPPGHWNLFAQFVSRRDRLGLNDDVKLFFAMNNALFDGAISCWDTKVTFDSVRPITAVRHLFNGQQVRAWAGPGQGTQLIDGGNWLPYQPSFFPSPPFGEYGSGHSTFSAAAAEILRLFTGNDRFGYSITRPAGSSTIEPGSVPATDVTLSWDTFSDAADDAGMSRRYGGIHFEQGDLDARASGRVVAEKAWSRAQSYINGG